MSKTRQYVQDKNIEVLFEEMMRHVINKKPEHPVKFLILLLQVYLHLFKFLIIVLCTCTYRSRLE